jgi:cellulose synthase (UDP-forming)
MMMMIRGVFLAAYDMGMMYFLYRFLALRWSEPSISALCVCETVVLLYGYINLVFLTTGLLKGSEQAVTTTPTDDDDFFHRPLEVCLFIPVYHEPLALIKETADAVGELTTGGLFGDVKLTICIGDDGNSDELEDLVDRCYPNIRYVRRSHVQGHAKAGNLNNLLKSTEALYTSVERERFVLVLDSDMVPRYDIMAPLLQTYFRAKNENIAFVQSPQGFTTFRGMRDVMGQSYYYFYRVVLRAWNGYGQGVPCCGTNVLFSRRALESIGGFQYGSITEDFNTSMVLHSRGYKSCYYHESVLAEGMSPMTLGDFFQQRLRWSLGGLQVLSRPGFWSDFRGLSPLFKYIYLTSLLSPLIYVCIAYLVVLPPLQGISPAFSPVVSITPRDYLGTFVAYIGAYMLQYIAMCLYCRVPWYAIVTSFQETVFIAPLQLYSMCAWGWSHTSHLLCCKNIPTRFIRTNKNLTSVSQFSWSSVCWVLPFIGYVLGATWRLAAKGVHPWADTAWILFALFQVYPPLVFFFLSLCLSSPSYDISRENQECDV